VGQLRGAGVSVDGRRVAQVLIGVVLATLAVLTVVFAIVGIHTNQQDDRLHDDGVPVTFTVTGCLGLLGGSGSNAAGYSCRGTYALGQRHYSEQLPGDSFYRPGSTVHAIAVPGDPALVSPAAIVATEHSSASVFILPAILLGVLVLLAAVLLLLRRRRRTDEPGEAPSDP
jgi:MYXO-CTERM domain-containing protein